MSVSSSTRRGFVVISGLPASGKTTVGVHLAQLLGLPLMDKDDYLEASFPHPAATVSPPERTRLSRAADAELQKRALASDGAVLVSFWRRPEISEESGTPTEWLSRLPSLVEVYCRCRPQIAMQRFLMRARHPSHQDDSSRAEEFEATFSALDRLGPLGVGHVIELSTEHEVDVPSVALEVESVWKRV